MRRAKWLPVIGLSIVLPLTACETNPDGTLNKQNIGTVLGAVGGGLLGSQIGGGSGRLAATAAGTLIGALAGSSIGKSLDNADRAAASRTTQSALERAPTGQVSSWRNPDSGNSGTVTPTRTYQSTNGETCREFTQTVTVDGKTEDAKGRACRQPDGTWQIVSN